MLAFAYSGHPTAAVQLVSFYAHCYLASAVITAFIQVLASILVFSPRPQCDFAAIFQDYNH